MAVPSVLSSDLRVALFVTCLTDQFYPRVGVAVTKILEHFACEVLFPDAQTCCGQPFFNNGFHPEARELAKRVIRIFEPYPYVVTPSGSCCAMVREHFSELFENEPQWKKSAHELAVKTYEFVEFLDKVMKVDFHQFHLPAPREITYHYTCHLRGLGIGNEGKRFLRQIGNVQFKPLKKTDQCCGFGGTFAVKYPAISGAIVEDKTRCIAESGAKFLICNEAGCTMNIAGMCHRQGMSTQVIHIAELLAEAMGIDADKWD